VTASCGSRGTGGARLLEPARGHRQGLHPWLAAHRRRARLDDENFIYIVDRRRTSSSAAARTSIPSRSKTPSTSTPPSPRWRRSASRTPILGEEVGAVIVLRPGARWRPTSSPPRGRPARRLQRADAPVVPRQPAAAQPAARCSSARCATSCSRPPRRRARPVNPVQPAAAVNSSNWASESSTVAAPALSSRCSTLEVPGIGSSTGDRRSNQARAT